MLRDLNYRYDEAGNVSQVSDTSNLGGASAGETQCFLCDGQRRLTEAWTPTSQNCSDTRSAANLSGPAPYWTSYSYNQAGQRATGTKHVIGGDTNTTYCGTDEAPHALSGTSGTANRGSPERAYGVDETGNTTRRRRRRTPHPLHRERRTCPLRQQHRTPPQAQRHHLGPAAVRQ
ncbi:hypothetical protein ACFRR7_09715 [Streptomyces sp. NPDC056909]|uniref:hypothetical protein n=1 Tax=Streptomyces sp. NPDC056909 TaxID=3345963 RepID=UPI00367B7461